MGRTIERYFIPVVVGFAPVLLMLLTWAPDGELSTSMRVTRSQVLPVVLSELIVIAISLRSGLLSTLGEIRPPMVAQAAIALLLLIMIGTAIVAPDPVTARFRTAYWIIHFLFGLSVMHLCRTTVSARDMIAVHLAGFALFVLLFVLFVTRIEDPATFDWTFGLPAAGHVRHYGYYAAAMIGLAVGTMAVAGARATWFAGFVVAGLGFGFALWTGSRGAAAAAIGAVLLGLLLVPALRRAKAWAGAVASLIVSLAIVAWLPAPAAHMGVARTVAATTGENIATGRTDLWGLVVEAILERPIFGYGEGQMSTVAPFFTMVHPHNALLQILLAWGIVGTLCAAIPAALFARFAIREVRRAEGWLVSAFMGMLTLAIFAAFDGTLYHGLPLAIFAACAGMIAAGRVEVAAPGR